VVPRPEPHAFWTGDVWKAVFDLRTRPDLDVAVGRFDWGVAVLRARPNNRPFSLPPKVSDWPLYLAHCKEGLNLMGYDELMRWAGVDATDKAGRFFSDLSELSPHFAHWRSRIAAQRLSQDESRGRSTRLGE
jgi:hypothetical protein